MVAVELFTSPLGGSPKSQKYAKSLAVLSGMVELLVNTALALGRQTEAGMVKLGRGIGLTWIRVTDAVLTQPLLVLTVSFTS